MGRLKEEWHPDGSRSLEDLRHMRLIALLWDMMETQSIEKAAPGQGGPA